MDRIKIVLFLFFLIFSSTVFAQQMKKEISNLHLPWIKFNWGADSLGNKYFEKTAIFIPIKIENLPYKFKAQFDLGSLTTMFYGNTISAYSNLSPKLKETKDSLTFQEGNFTGFKNINLHLDNILFPNLTIMKMPDYGDSISPNSVKSSDVKNIGTIGGDLFENKILIIDYPNQRICIVDSLPLALLKKIHFITNAKFSSTGRLKIPFKIGEKEVYLMLDTGSSIFPILTYSQNALSITNANTPVADSVGGSNWGKIIYIYEKKFNDKMFLENLPIHNNSVYYTDKGVSKKFCDRNQIFGYTGNVLFLNDILVIDNKNKKFGVL